MARRLHNHGIVNRATDVAYDTDATITPADTSSWCIITTYKGLRGLSAANRVLSYGTHRWEFNFGNNKLRWILNNSGAGTGIHNVIDQIEDGGIIGIGLIILANLTGNLVNAWVNGVHTLTDDAQAAVNTTAQTLTFGSNGGYTAQAYGFPLVGVMASFNSTISDMDAYGAEVADALNRDTVPTAYTGAQHFWWMADGFNGPGQAPHSTITARVGAIDLTRVDSGDNTPEVESVNVPWVW